MKTDVAVRLDLGDHVRVITYSRGGENVIEGAFLKATEEALHLITSKDPSRESTRVPHTKVRRVEVLTSAPHAIFEQSNQRFDYGTRVFAMRDGSRFVGEVVAAWKEVVVIRRDPTKDGHEYLYMFYGSQVHRIIR